PAASGAVAPPSIAPRYFDRCQINYETVVANSETACVVAAASDRQEQIILSRKIYGIHYVRHICAACDQTRLLVDHRVVYLTHFVVVLVLRLYQSTAQARLEIGNSVFVKHNEVSLKEP